MGRRVYTLFSILVLWVLLFSPSAYSQYNWSSAGLEGGIIKSMYVRSDGVVYVGTQRGVYISIDFGTTWFRGATNLHQYGINALIVVGTLVFAAADNGGFYISYDNGYNFSLIYSGLNINTLCKVDQTIYAGIGNSIVNSGILISTNYGVNWSQTNLPGNTVVNDIVTDDVALYAATNNGVYLAYHIGTSWNKFDFGIPANTKVFSLKKNGFIILAATDKGIYRSTDNGNTWNAANSGLTTGLPFLAVTIQGSTAFTCQFGKGVYKASNYGDNWVQVYTGLNDYMIHKFGVYNANLFGASAGGGMYLSVDGGNNWIPKNSGLSVHTINALNYVGSVMYAGTQGGGVYRSLNLGANWVPRNELLGNTVVYNLTQAGAFIYAGTYGGIFRNNGSGVWEAMNTGLTDSVVFALNYNGVNLYAGTQSGGIYKSTNFGALWTKLTGIIYNDTVYALANIGTTVFASTKRNGFVKSIDEGLSWQTINNGFNGVPYSLSLAVKGNNLYSSVFNGSPQSGIFKSPDSGNSWNWISNPVSEASYSVHTYLNNIFASYYNNAGGIIRATSNEGASWTLITSNPGQWGDNCDVRCMQVFANYLYAGTSGKSLWRIPISDIVSVKNISSNVPEKYGLMQNYPNPFNPVTKIKFDVPDLKSSHGSSSLSSSNVSIGDPVDGNGFSLSSSNVSIGDLIQIIVYDVMGREVQTLVNDRLKPGSYETTFDGSGLNSGVYFYRLAVNGQTVGFNSTKKMILLK